MRPAIVAAALALALTGCGGGARTSSPVPAQQTAVVSMTIVTRNASSSARNPRYISANAKSVAIGVTPGNAAYAPASGCANVVANVSTYTIQVNAPVGTDAFTIQAFDGPCVTSSSGSTGSGNLLDTISSISGTVTAGAANTLNPAGVAPAQPCPGGGCAIAIAQVVNVQTTAMSFTASLDAGTGFSTTFEFDPGVTMALPVAFTLKDNAGNALTSPDANGQTIKLLQPLTFALTDTSVAATPQTLGLALVDGSGSVYCPSGPSGGAATVTFAPAATPTCAGNRTTAGTVFAGSAQPTVNFQLTAAPRTNDRIVVVYNGATQSAFQSATLTATMGGATLASIPIAGQSQVVTQFAGPAGPTGIAVSSAGSVEFVTAGTKIYAQIAGTALGAGSNAVAGANLTGVAYMNAVAPATYAVDPNCAGCDATHVGIYQTGATPGAVNGATPTQLTTVGALTTAGFNQAIIPPFLKGPIGLAALASGQGGAATFGSLLVAANNAIYKLDLASASTISAITIVAGTGVGGTGGQGSNDAANGLQARFNFGTVPFVGLALDNGASNLFLADPGNNAVRRIALFSQAATVTYATYQGAPAGVALDTVNGVVLAAIPSANAIASVAALGATPSTFAGAFGPGTQDGLTQKAYPLQFNAGNAVANPAGGSVLPAYAGLYNASATVPIGVNSNRGAQSSAGLSGFVASLRGPQGIALDPASNPNGKFYFVDAGSALIRTLL